jgi:hypothetical protein
MPNRHHLRPARRAFVAVFAAVSCGVLPLVVTAGCGDKAQGTTAGTAAPTATGANAPKADSQYGMTSNTSTLPPQPPKPGEPGFAVPSGPNAVPASAKQGQP